MRIAAVVLLAALLFPTAAALASRMGSPCCCKAAKTCPMKRKAESCSKTGSLSCGVRHTERQPAIGTQMPAILAAAAVPRVYASPARYRAAAPRVSVHELQPPEPPPPKQG